MQEIQIIYVVTFDDSNYCFEQAVLSMCSVRMHNPQTVVRMVTDPASASLITGWRKDLLRAYHCEVLAFEVPERFNKLERSRYLKTRLRLLVDGDFLFIDTDTIICRPLNDVRNVKGDIGAVLDSHLLLDENLSVRTENFRFKLAGIDTSDDPAYFNSGVMWVRETPAAREFYKQWSKRWLTLCEEKKIHYDQLSLYLANRQLGHLIQPMAGEWNCQLGGWFLKSLSDAYIIHYYASSHSQEAPFFYFKNEKLYQKIRKHGRVSEEMIESLRHPHLQFNSNYVLLSGDDLAAYKKSKACYDLCMESPRRFWLIDKLARLLQKTYKR